MRIEVGRTLMSTDWRVQLRAVPLFGRFSPPEFDRVVSDAVPRRLDAGEALIRCGEPAHDLHAVLSGNLILRVDEDDEGGIVDIVGSGTCLGEDAILEAGTYPVTAEALTMAEVVTVPGPALRAELENRFELVLPLLGEMSVRLRSLVHQITDLKMRSASERLAAYLLSLCGVSDGPATVRLPFEKKVVADELGMKPETLSRAIAKIQPVGVRYNRREDAFRIADVAKLGEFASRSELDL